jgi:2-polyprenyl-3-methyl-5-hydroxy-6-metoxy-1,4-benzoquinol methylase
MLKKKNLKFEYIYDLKNKKIKNDLDIAYKKIKNLWPDQLNIKNPRYIWVFGFIFSKLNYSLKKKIHVMDIGCGYGTLVNQLNKNSIINAQGIDISNHAIQMGLKKYKKNKISVQDICQENFKIDKKFDTILVLGVFWLVFENFKRFYKNLKKIKKEKAEIIFCINFPKDNNIFRDKIKNEHDLLLFLKKYFKIDTCLRYENLNFDKKKLTKDSDFLIIVARFK